MNIGLIAMSGIRACDPELLALGLTLPGFVERSKTIASLPSLGLLTLAGMTPSRHSVQYIECPSIDVLPDPLPPFDLVAISALSAQIFDAYAIADRYRAMGIPVILGGLHVSSMPFEAARHGIPAVGEGELLWLRILEDAERGQLRAVYQADGSFDLRDAPMPAFELLDPERYNRITIQTSRGCPHRCEFCASSILLTNRYKQKPAEKVLAEIDRVLSLWDHPFLEFADDNTFIDRNYWKALLPQLAKRDVRWFTETDISVANDTELLDEMRRAGCAQILIGLESPVESGLPGIELNSDWKRRVRPRYLDAIRTIQERGISVNGCFVLGLDGQTPEVFEQVYRFVEEAELYEVQVTLQTAFPGTPLYRRLQREDRIIEDGRWDKCTLFDINFRPSHMTLQELDRGFKDLIVRLYSDDFTAWRRDTFIGKQRRAWRRDNARVA